MAKFRRREFLQLAAIGGAASAVSQQTFASIPATGTPHVEESTIPDLQRAMDTGVSSSRALVGGYLARIETLNPRLNAVVEVNPDAMAIAEQRDRERAAGRIR